MVIYIINPLLNQRALGSGKIYEWEGRHILKNMIKKEYAFLVLP